MRRQSGVTLIELMVVVAIMGVLAALATPQLRVWREDSRVRSGARSVADAFHVARTEAMRTGQNHIVFIGATLTFAPLTDGEGRVQIVVVNDGAPGTGNCSIDPGEWTQVFTFERGVTLGLSEGSAPAPGDTGVGAAPVTFTQPRAGNPAAQWVLFGPDGIPVGLNNTCTVGRIGTGGGGVYISNGRVDYGVTLTQLGAVRASGWEEGEGVWK